MGTHRSVDTTEAAITKNSFTMKSVAASLICAVFISVVAGQSVKVPPPPTSPSLQSAATDSGTKTAAPVTTPMPTGDPNCLDNIDSCNRYTPTNCIGAFEGWAKANCRRWCGYCKHPNDTAPKECKDNKPNCKEYKDDICTLEEYRIFAEENCAKYCNKCGETRPRYLIGLEQAGATTPAPTSERTTAGSGCRDLVDYCWNEPDRNCFGIYGGWAKTNCAFRCGFCTEKPKCENELLYCSQYKDDICTDPNYQGWARKNCRKRCNLCALPTEPTDVVTMAPGAVSPSPVAPSSGGGPTPAPPSSSGNITDLGLYLGKKSTYIFQGDASNIPDVCFHKGEVKPLDGTWYDGCDYICSCFDPKKNRIICTDRCVQWDPLPGDLTGCSLVKEPGVCCRKLECNQTN